MLIQKELEAKITSAITTALSAASVECDVTGAWATSQAGLVKWIENDGGAAIINVAVGCPQWQSYSTPLVQFTANISLFIRPELDPQGSRLASVAGVIEDLLNEWMAANYQQNFTALDLSTLSIDGVSMGGGNSPSINGSVCSVTWNLTLSGSYRAANEQTNP